MSTQKSIKLSDYVEYPFLIPSIYLDFDIGTDCVVVQSSMIIKPKNKDCLLYTSPSPRDRTRSRMPSSA